MVLRPSPEMRDVVEYVAAKPAYAICFILFLAANIALALQNSYAALMVLRCLQSTGSSVTVPLGAGTVADIATRAERGKYISYASLGVTLGPALGPVIGGLLIQYLGWRSTFWFLAIFTAALLPLYFLLVPGTARSVVGNGSIPAPRLFMTPFQHIERKRNPATQKWDSDRAALKAKRQRLNPLAALKILGEKEGGVTLGFGALMFATSVFIAGVWLCFSPLLWLVMIYGGQWREEKQAETDKAKRKAEETEEEDTSLKR